MNKKINSIEELVELMQAARDFVMGRNKNLPADNKDSLCFIYTHGNEFRGILQGDGEALVAGMVDASRMDPNFEQFLYKLTELFFVRDIVRGRKGKKHED
ncbi:MAG: hypothetical protein IK114_14095 [Fibrobacter sp.]|nr:hypothetical protein [Fibrobacter sp.]